MKLEKYSFQAKIMSKFFSFSDAMVEWLARLVQNPKVVGSNLAVVWPCGVSFGKTLYADLSTPHPSAKWVPAS